MSLPSEYCNKRSQFERQYKHKNRALNNLGPLKVLENPATKSRIFMREQEFPDAESFMNALKRYQARIQSKNSFFVEFFDFSTFTKIDKKCQVYKLRVFVEYFPSTLQTKIDEFQKKQTTMPYDQMARLMHFFLRAGKFLQTQKKCHGDIRPSNILFFDKSNQVKFLERLNRLHLPFPHNQIHLESTVNGQNEERIKDSNLYVCPLIYKSLKTGKKLPVSFDIQKSEVFSAGLCILEAGIGQSIQGIYRGSADEINAVELANLLKEFQVNYSKSSVIFGTLCGMLSIYENDRKTSSQLLDEFRSADYALEEIERENLLNSSKLLSQVNASFYDATFLESQRSIVSNFHNENSFLQPSSRRTSRLDPRSFNRSADIHMPSRNSTYLQVPTQHMGFFNVTASEEKSLIQESNRYIEAYSKMQESQYSIDLSFQQSNKSIQMSNGFAPSNRFMNDSNFDLAYSLVPEGPRMSTATIAESRPSKLVLYKGNSKRKVTVQQNHQPMPHLQPSNFQRQVADFSNEQLDVSKAKHIRNFSLDPRMTQEYQPSPNNNANYFSKNKNNVVYYEETQVITEDIKAVFNQRESSSDQRNNSSSKRPTNFAEQQIINQFANNSNPPRMHSPIDSRFAQEQALKVPKQSTFAQINSNFFSNTGQPVQNTSHSPSPFQRKSDSVHQPSQVIFEPAKQVSHHSSISQQSTSPIQAMRRNDNIPQMTFHTVIQAQNQQIKTQPSFEQRPSHSPIPQYREYQNQPTKNMPPSFAIRNDSHSPSPFAKPTKQPKNNTMAPHLVPPPNIAHQRVQVSPQPVVLRKESSTASFYDMQNSNLNGISYQTISTQVSEQQINPSKTPTFGLRREESSPNFSRNFTDMTLTTQTPKRQSETGLNLIGKTYQTSNFFNV